VILCIWILLIVMASSNRASDWVGLVFEKLISLILLVAGLCLAAFLFGGILYGLYSLPVGMAILIVAAMAMSNCEKKQ
jgi:hypothetical protein